MSENDDNREKQKSSKENENGGSGDDDDCKESEQQHMDYNSDSDSNSSGGGNDSSGDNDSNDDDDDDDDDDESDRRSDVNTDDDDNEGYEYNHATTIIKVAIRRLKRFMEKEEDDDDSNNVAADELVQLLQQYPDAIVQGYFENYQTDALHDACERKKATPLALIRAIYEAWPDAVQTRDYKSDDNRLPLDCALRNKTVAMDVIEFLLQQYPESIQLPSSTYDKEVSLHHACENGVSWPVLERLIRPWPAALHIKASMGTPLHYACNHTHVSVSPETLAGLITAWPGALQVRNPDGEIPLHMACRYFSEHDEAMALMIHPWPQAVQITTHKDEKRVALHLVCEKSQVSLTTLQLLIRTWPDAVRCKDKAGFLPLHLACRQQMPTDIRPGGRERSLPLIQCLVTSWPPSVQSHTRKGMLPLHFCCLDPAAPIEMIRYLLELYPKAVQAEDRKGRLPLHLACTKRRPAEEADDESRSPFPLSLAEIIECLVRAWPDAVHVYRDHNTDQDCYHEFRYSVDDPYINWNYRHGGERTDIDYNDDVDFLEWRLPLDLACSSFEGLTPAVIALLTDGAPPLHFALSHPYTSARMKTLEYLNKILRNDDDNNNNNEWMRFHNDMLPFHCACRAGAPRSALRWCLQQYPEAIRITTTNTEDTPLHCYLTFIGTRTASLLKDSSIRQLYLCSAVQFLVEQYPPAVYSRNRHGLLPFQVAALHQAPLDILFYLMQQNPGSLWNA